MHVTLFRVEQPTSLSASLSQPIATSAKLITIPASLLSIVAHDSSVIMVFAASGLRRLAGPSSAPLRSFSASAFASKPPTGFFARPPVAPSSTALPTEQLRKPPVAMPHTPPHIPAEQSPNYPTTWSESQNPREAAMRGPRFEQIDIDTQPMPLSAMEMIQREPIRLTGARIAACDGGACPFPQCWSPKRGGRSNGVFGGSNGPRASCDRFP